MALGKIVKEVVGTLAEEIAKEAPEAIPKRVRKTFKSLSEVPDEIRKLPLEERAVKASEFLDEPKVDDFVKVRQEDIVKDTGATYAKVRKTAEQLDDARWEKELFGEYLPETNEAKLAMLEERQRDLYLKAYNLSKEKERIADMEKVLADGGSPLDSILDTITTTPGTGRTFSNIEARTNAIYNRINTDMFDLKEGLRTKWLGFKQDIPLADDMIRYLKDGVVKNTDRLDEVKKIADQWTKASERIKTLRNRAGARVGKLEDWILPQSHDARKIRKAGARKWIAGIENKLDRPRIEAEQGRPLQNVLEDAYKNITAVDVETTAGKGTVLAKRGEEHRVLHFKTGDDMIAYKNEFGNPDTFSTMDSHIRRQSNEIAAMQLFGANPENTYNKLKELARAGGMGTTKEGHLDRAWRMATGQADGDDIVDKLDAWLAMIFGTHRSIQVGSKLGTASISSLADIASIIIGSGYRGLSSIKMLGRGLDTLLQEITTVGKVGTNTQLANRIGVVSEFASASLANSRYAEVGTGAAQKAAEVVIRASGLGSYTNSMRIAVGLEMAGSFAENFTKTLDETPFARMFKEYGITPKDWDVIRKTKPFDAKGAKFLDTKKIYAVDEQLGYRVNEMMSNEMDAFVVMPSDRTRVWTTWGAKKGTIQGEAARNMMLFKSFPVAITMMHLKRIGKIDSTMGKVAYSGAVIGVNTVMVVITMWAYDLATGKTPRKADRPQMIAESLVKSGGLGIFEDLVLGGDKDRYGHSWTSTMVGVPAGTVEDVVKTLQDVIHRPHEPKTWTKAYNRAKAYIPGQNLWYTRAVTERTIGQFFGEMIDPKYEAKLRRRKKAMRLRGQKYLLD